MFNIAHKTKKPQKVVRQFKGLIIFMIHSADISLKIVSRKSTSFL